MIEDEDRSGTRLVDVTLAELRRVLITAALLLTTLYLFLGMVGSVLLAGVLGGVVGVYLLPLSEWLRERIGNSQIAAALSLLLLLLPVLAVVAYGYSEVESAAEYLQENTDRIAAEIHSAIARLPILTGTGESSIRNAVRAVADAGASLPAKAQGLLGGFLVSASIFLFTAFYIMTSAEEIVAYLRESVPPRYAALAETLEANARGVLYGTIFAVLVTQGLKATLLLALFLILGVPIPVTLAVIAFFVGFFPVVGSWTVYVPAAAYLLIFEGAPVRALILLAAGFTVSTLVLSLYVRPKLAAEQSGVLNFYWMFLGLVAGVYAFGLPGVIVGPLLIGLLKAVLDTVRASGSWQGEPTDAGDPDAEVLAEEELERD